MIPTESTGEGINNLTDGLLNQMVGDEFGHRREPCMFCKMPNPDHPGRYCPKNPKFVARFTEPSPRIDKETLKTTKTKNRTVATQSQCTYSRNRATPRFSPLGEKEQGAWISFENLEGENPSASASNPSPRSYAKHGEYIRRLEDEIARKRTQVEKLREEVYD